MTNPPVADQLAIQNLFSRYMWALDGGDVEGILACFAPDGALESPAVGRYAGHDGIREFATRFSKFRERGAQMRHMISNIVTEVDGDRATAKCYLVVFITQNEASRLLGPGRYDCRIKKVGGEWLFDNRLVVMDHDYVLEGI